MVCEPHSGDSAEVVTFEPPRGATEPASTMGRSQARASAAARTSFNKFSCEDMESTVDDKDLLKWTKQFGLQGNLLAPGKDDRAHRFDTFARRKVPAPGLVLSASLLRVGMSVPLHPFVVQVLRKFDVAPFQLSPNSYRMIISLYILYKEMAFPTLSVPEFLWFYTIKKKADDAGFFYLTLCGGKDIRGIEGFPSNSGEWKKKYFYWLGESEVRTVFSPSPVIPARPELGDNKLINAQTICELSSEERDYRHLLTTALLIKHGFLPAGASLEHESVYKPPSATSKGKRRIVDHSIKQTTMPLLSFMQKRADFMASGSGEQTPAAPIVNPFAAPTLQPAVNPDVVSLTQNPVEGTNMAEMPEGPLCQNSRKRLRGKEKEKVVAATVTVTVEDPVAQPYTATPFEILGELAARHVPEEELGSLASLTADQAQDFVNQNLVKVTYCQLVMAKNTDTAAKEVTKYKKKVAILDKRMASLKKEFTAKASNLKAKMKSLEESCAGRVKVFEEKIDSLSAEKASAASDFEERLKAKSNELEELQTILASKQAQIKQFEAVKKKAVDDTVTYTTNLFLESFVAAVPEFDYARLGDDVAKQVEEIRAKLAAEAAKQAAEAANRQKTFKEEA